MKRTVNFPASVCWISLLLLLCTALSGAEVKLERPAPAFAAPNCLGVPCEILGPGVYSVKGEGKRFFSTRHPLAWYNIFHQLGSGRWVAPELTVDAENNVYRSAGSDWRFFCCAIAFALALGALFLLISGKCRKKLPPEHEGTSINCLRRLFATRKV